jgi:hypothetical protein
LGTGDVNTIWVGIVILVGKFGFTGILIAFWSNNFGSWCAIALLEALMLLKLIRLVCLLQSLDGCLNLSLEFIDGELSWCVGHF